MADKDVLSQEEIDALLTGVDDGNVDTEVGEDGTAEVTAFDLTNQDRVVRGRLPTVELISERFARMLRRDLPSSIKVPMEVGPGGVQIIKYSEYADTLQVPSCIKLLKIAPFEGTCMMSLDAKLIHRLVDLFFGGAGNVSQLERKEFTLTEKRVIERITQLVIKDLEAAWQDVLPVKAEVVGDEINPALVNVIAPADAMLVTSFRLELEEGGGELHIAFPYSALEPYKNVLDAPGTKEQQGADLAWRAAMERAILDVDLPLNCVIGDVDLCLRDLMDMQIGEVVDLNMQDEHQVWVSNVPVFKAVLGDSRGRFALEFESFSNH